MDQYKIILENRKDHLFFVMYLFLYQIQLYQFGKIMFLELIESKYAFKHLQLNLYRFYSHQYVKLRLIQVLDKVICF